MPWINNINIYRLSLILKKKKCPKCVSMTDGINEIKCFEKYVYLCNSNNMTYKKLIFLFYLRYCCGL